MKAGFSYYHCHGDTIIVMVGWDGTEMVSAFLRFLVWGLVNLSNLFSHQPLNSASLHEKGAVLCQLLNCLLSLAIFPEMYSIFLSAFYLKVHSDNHKHSIQKCTRYRHICGIHQMRRLVGWHRISLCSCTYAAHVANIPTTVS